MEPPSMVTLLLARMREGEPDALDQLLPIVYDELRRIAQSFMRKQGPGHTLQPTALVHEAFLKLFAGSEPEFANRAHFLAVMARVMRQVLVDHARTAAAAKRGGEADRVEWDSNAGMQAERGTLQIELLDLHAALDALAAENPSLAQAVEMNYFGGMTAEEIAAAAGRSVHIVRHDLRLGRAWLHRELAR